VSCTNDACTVTLGARSTTEVFGTLLSFESVPDGTAIIQIGDRSVSFTGGEVVTATSLTLRCTAVTPDTVTLVVTPA